MEVLTFPTVVPLLAAVTEPLVVFMVNPFPLVILKVLPADNVPPYLLPLQVASVTTEPLENVRTPLPLPTTVAVPPDAGIGWPVYQKCTVEVLGSLTPASNLVTLFSAWVKVKLFPEFVPL